MQAWGHGEGVIADPRYRTIRTVKAGNGYSVDVHEFTLTPSGDALFTATRRSRSTSRERRPDKLTEMLDSIVQEVDVRTGLVVWEWHAYGHIPLADSYATPQNSSDFDAFHVNSIEVEPDNRLLISARDTSAVYLVNRTNGHDRLDARRQGEQLHAGPRRAASGSSTTPRCSPRTGQPVRRRGGTAVQGAVLPRPDPRARPAPPHRSRRPAVPPPRDDAWRRARAACSRSPNGNVFVGFGSTEFFSEFSPTGTLVVRREPARRTTAATASTGSRGARRPTTKPDVAARKRTAGSGVDVYASWNGATTVARWQVLGGASAGSLTPLTTVGRHGFETHIAVSAAPAVIAVKALDGRGHVLAESRKVNPS